jgi:hypothetical protein
VSLEEGELAALVDTLLPGDGLFPKASATGMLAKLRERLGAEAAALDRALVACGGPLLRLGEAERTGVLARLEREHKALFEAVLRTFYLTYYGTEAVAAAIAATGIDYHLTPQPLGYRLEPFDPAVDTPRHGRGRWLRTEEVRRVALPEGLAP